MSEDKKFDGKMESRNYLGNIPKGDNKRQDISMRIKNQLVWYTRKRCETDEEFEERSMEFFESCMENGEIMTWEKYCLALGYNTTEITNMELGRVPDISPFRRKILKKARQFMASFDAESVLEGAINPIAYIFRSKNFYGMKDEQELVIDSPALLGEVRDPEGLADRYLKSIPDDLSDDEEEE